MGQVHHLKDIETIEDEAARWVLRLQDRDCTAKTENTFRSWLQLDPRHRAAVESYRELWERFDDLCVVGKDLQRDIMRAGNDDGGQAWWRDTAKLVRYGAIAAVLIIALLSVTMLPRFSSQNAAAAVTYATSVGESRTVKLPDGSVVDLNTNTIVEVAFSPSERRILLQRGEAHFEVAKNPSRPFIVDAGQTQVRAVGTVFNVERLPDMPVEVIVTEGRVAVTRVVSVPGKKAGGRKETTYVDAGARLGGSAPEGLIEPVTPDDVEQKLAWRQGMLVFKGEPLDQVLGELGRYSDTHFVIMDDGLKTEPVGGHFKMGDIDALLASLEAGLDLRSEKRPGNVVLVYRAKDPEPLAPPAPVP